MSCNRAYITDDVKKSNQLLFFDILIHLATSEKHFLEEKEDDPLEVHARITNDSFSTGDELRQKLDRLATRTHSFSRMLCKRRDRTFTDGINSTLKLQ